MFPVCVGTHVLKMATGGTKSYVSVQLSLIIDLIFYSLKYIQTNKTVIYFDTIHQGFVLYCIQIFEFTTFKKVKTLASKVLIVIS
jgi:hypothetical protein